MTAPYQGRPPPADTASLDDIVGAVTDSAPAMEFYFMAFPGNPFAGEHHFAAFMRGTTPLTSRLLKPVLIDAQTAEVTDSRELPWYLSALLLSQPLHFGDYGGLTLKILWADAGEEMEAFQNELIDEYALIYVSAPAGERPCGRARPRPASYTPRRDH